MPLLHLLKPCKGISSPLQENGLLCKMHTAKERISLIHRLASKTGVQLLSTLSLDLCSGGNYVQYEADIHLLKDRMIFTN